MFEEICEDLQTSHCIGFFQEVERASLDSQLPGCVLYRDSDKRTAIIIPSSLEHAFTDWDCYDRVFWVQMGSWGLAPCYFPYASEDGTWLISSLQSSLGLRSSRS